MALRCSQGAAHDLAGGGTRQLFQEGHLARSFMCREPGADVVLKLDCQLFRRFRAGAQHHEGRRYMPPDLVGNAHPRPIGRSPDDVVGPRSKLVIALEAGQVPEQGAVGVERSLGRAGGAGGVDSDKRGPPLRSRGAVPNPDRNREHRTPGPVRSPANGAPPHPAWPGWPGGRWPPWRRSPPSGRKWPRDRTGRRGGAKRRPASTERDGTGRPRPTVER